MCSYNQIKNSYGSQNSWTLNYLLKNELDYWWAQHDGVASALAGLDMTMAGDQNLASGNTYWGTNLTNAVLNGTIPQWRLDDMVVRIMSAFFKVGRDTARVPVNFNSWTLNTTGYLHPEAEEDFQQVNWHVNVRYDHAALIREIGGASTVLLKNTNNALPLNKPKSIAVIREDSHDNPSGPNACGDRGCDIGTLVMGWGSGTANFPYLIAPVTALRAQAAHDHSAFTNVSDNYDFDASGATTLLMPKKQSYSATQIPAKTILQLTATKEIETTLPYGGMTMFLLTSLLPLTQTQSSSCIQLVQSLWKPTRTTPMSPPSSGPVYLVRSQAMPLLNVFYGNVNPQAKSVFTWGKKREDWVTDVLYNTTQDPPQLNFVEGVFIDYRHFDIAGIEPSYEFGFGLSYTTFAYFHLVIEKQNPGPYQPTTGWTKPAPTFGTIDYDPAHAEFPPDFHAVPFFVYPYLDGPLLTGQPQTMSDLALRMARRSR